MATAAGLPSEHFGSGGNDVLYRACAAHLSESVAFLTAPMDEVRAALLRKVQEHAASAAAATPAPVPALPPHLARPIMQMIIDDSGAAPAPDVPLAGFGFGSGGGGGGSGTGAGSAEARLLQMFREEIDAARYSVLDDKVAHEPLPPLPPPPPAAAPSAAPAAAAAAAAAAGPKVLIIGAGPSGICAAVKCRLAGIPFEVLEMGTACGGAWHHNRYPGAGCDVPSHFYSYSFAPNARWSRYFSRAAEIAAYFEAVARRYDVLRFVRFRTEVTAAVFDARTATWELTCRCGGGGGGGDGGGGIGGRSNSDGGGATAGAARLLVLTADAVVSAVGQLSRPFVPPLPGRAAFAGPAVHTAEWPTLAREHGLASLVGKRVAVVGTGASAMQLLRHVAAEAAHVTVFQSAPSWVAENGLYHRRMPPRVAWRMEHVPVFHAYYRFRQLWRMSDGNYGALLAGSEMNRAARARMERYARAQCAAGDDGGSSSGGSSSGGGRPLLAKVLPAFPPYCSRVLQDNGWFATLRRENVRLVPHRVSRIVGARALEAGGVEYGDVDVIIYCTGFRSSDFLFPMKVRGDGADGADVRARWRAAGGAEAYLGISVPRLPNFWLCYGPNTNLGHGGSVIFHSECQVRYIMQALALLRRRGAGTALGVKQAVCDEYNARAQAQLGKTVWADAGCTSWYKTKDGKITNNSPWTLLDYFSMTRAFREDDYHVTQSSSSSSAGARRTTTTQVARL